MLISWLLAALHLLALGMGLGAVIVRGRALAGPLSETRLRTAFLADNLWGGAAAIWITTGLWRAFGGVEKGTAYYLGSTAFQIKMGALAGILLLELWPMITLIRWRIARGRGSEIDFRAAPAIGRISAVQAILVVAMVFAATAMSRGIGGW
jgi:putative membrane protein